MHVLKNVDRAVMRLLSVMSILLLLTGSAWAQNIKVTGKVTDKSNLPIPGVSVTVEGVRGGTATDANGAYTLNVPANGLMVFSAIGMETVKVQVNNRAVVNVTMSESAILLEDVVVTALGIKKERKEIGRAHV